MIGSPGYGELKQQLLELTATLPQDPTGKAQGAPGETSEIVEKIGRIRSLLTNYPYLKKDPEVLGSLLTYTEKKENQAIAKLRSDLIFTNCCAQDSTVSDVGSLVLKDGVLIIPEEVLNKMDQHAFWDFIGEHGVRELVIQPEKEEPIIYNAFVLEKLAATRPSFEDLTKQIKLVFEGAPDAITVLKAKLLLCGDIFRGWFQSDVMETQGEIKFGQTREWNLFDGFSKILNAVETGEYNVKDPVFVNAVDFLDFSLPIPEGFIGQAEWEKYFGDVGQVPLPPMELIDAWEGPCPIFPGKNFCDTHVVVYVPSTIDGKPLTINAMGELATKPKSGGKATKYNYIWDRISDGIGKDHVKGGYWLAMVKELLPGTLGKPFAEQQGYIQKHCGGYVVPSTIDVIVGTLMHYVCSGKKQERLLDQVVTRCKEKVAGEHLVVGVFALSGLYVCSSDVFNRAGVAPVRKFFGS